ncbi:MAG: S16 family serine protease [Candidatus Micrarchaeia archaeon]
MKALVPLLFIVSVCAAAGMYVPAVSDGDYGSLVWMHIEEVPGKGGVYVSVKPLAGESLQSSIMDSVACASSRGNNFSSSLLLVGSDAPDGTAMLDGPSAGVALTSLLLSMRDGSALRNDTTVTGGIAPSCEVQPVGGLAEKVEAAAKKGMRAVLVPPSGPEEAALLDRLHIETGVAVYEYSSLDEAYGLLTSDIPAGHKVSYGNASYLGEGLDSVEPNPALDSAVEAMISELKGRASLISPKLASARAYSSNKSALADTLYAKGYSYSAGNEAFLALVALAPLTRGLDDRNISALSYEVQSCVDRVSYSLNATLLDAEHFSNAELRLYWASREVAGHKEAPQTVSQRMRRVQSLERARLWCMLADNIVKDGLGNGSTNSTRLREVVSALVNNYSKEGPATERLAEASDALNRGNYGAALVLVSMHESQVSSEGTENYAPVHKWSRMLAHHSQYLSANTDYGEKSGRSIMLFAKMLDRHFTEVESGEAVTLTYIAANAGAAAGGLEGNGSSAPEPVGGNGGTPVQDDLQAAADDEKAQRDRITLLIFTLICILLAFAIALRALRKARRR